MRMQNRKKHPQTSSQQSHNYMRPRDIELELSDVQGGYNFVYIYRLQEAAQVMEDRAGCHTCIRVATVLATYHILITNLS
jgi:hypothetical protein